MKSVRLARMLSTASLAALVLGVSPRESRAEDEVWRALADSPAVVARFAWESLDGSVPGLSGFEARFDEVEAFAQDEPDRTALAERVGMSVSKAKEALAAAGFEFQGFDRLYVVHVRSKTGPSGAALSASGNALLWRERTTALAPVPEVRRPPDGPPTASRAVADADRVLAALDEAAGAARSSAGPGSLSNAVARAMLLHVRLSASTPPWLREGLVAWLESVAFPDAAKAPLHVCGASVAQVTGWLSSKARPTACQARLLGRLVSAALSGATDGPARVERLAAAGAGAAKELAGLLGRDPAAVLADVPVPAGKERPRCDAAGTLPCPLCHGAGKVEVACETCFGLGGVACPSCDGDPACGAPGCCNGVQIRENGEYPCKACFGTGMGYCHTCEDKVRFPCKPCGGSGRAMRPCLVCRGKGRVACPDGGEVESPDGEPPHCPWCFDPAAKTGCATCFGSGFVGCRTCFGTGRIACPACYGAGCKKCGNTGVRECPDGDGTKSKCVQCGGSGTVASDPERCAACSGGRRALDAGTARARMRERAGGIDAALRARNGEVVGKAVRFLLSSTAATDEFTLREPRWIPSGALGALRKPSFYSNAEVLSSLLASRVGLDRPEMSKALSELRGHVRRLLEGTLPAGQINVQSVSLALRALVAGDDPADRPLVEGLVKRLVAAQRPSGHWADDLDSKEPGEAYSSLYAVESLWLASRKGALVPSATWSRALSAASQVSTAIPKAMRRNGFLTATDVCSSAALILMAKAGSLGPKARNPEEYRSIPQVVQALAWLDRHFELVREPVVASGARIRGSGDGGWAAWLYALERLARLLSIDEFGGRRWYADGCRLLASLQMPDGDFEELHRGRLNGPVRTTTSVLLFLSRATPPLTGEDSSDSANPDDPDAPK